MEFDMERYGRRSECVYANDFEMSSKIEKRMSGALVIHLVASQFALKHYSLFACWGYMVQLQLVWLVTHYIPGTYTNTIMVHGLHGCKHSAITNGTYFIFSHIIYANST